DGPSLVEVVRAEPGQPLDAEREVELQGLFETVLLGVSQDGIGELLGLGNRERGIGERDEPSVQTHHWRRVRRQMEVRRTHFDHLLQQLVECRVCGHQSPKVTGEFKLPTDKKEDRTATICQALLREPSLEGPPPAW